MEHAQLEQVQRLTGRLAEIHNLRRAAAVLSWDQATYMPPGGATARAEQLATLQAVSHRMLVDPDMGRVLDAAEAEVQRANLSADAAAASLVRVARREYRQATSVPRDLVAELARTASLGRQAWVTARAANNFAAFAPWLRKGFDLARRQADYLGYDSHPYDALLDLYEPGMTVAQVEPLFRELRAGIVSLLRAIVARAGAVDAGILDQPYAEDAQLRFAGDVARRLGYDFARGRLDLTAHPFATGFAIDDVRITTRVDPGYLATCLMGTIHETGHGLYEQNIDAALEGTPLAEAASLGMHESQSRLWENVVGRSLGFWQHYIAPARQAFPAQLAGVDAEAVYRALNRVTPSPIRIEADEVTYNLHIMLRFELEKALMEDRLRVEDVPEAWNAAMTEYVGIAPANDAEGALQDTHWSEGLIGYFPTYAIGNVLSVQLYEAAVAAIPRIPAGIARGEFGPLLGWLRENVYRHGRTFEAGELIRRATGRSMIAGPYLRYLRDKFGAIYGLSDEAVSPA